MELEHAFTVPVGVEEAWEVLRDIERVAPCMPGATIESVDGDDFTGRVKVKVGPMQITYRGNASFVDVDEAARRARIEARGRETRGSGTADATITANLTSEGDASTRVEIVTDLTVTGKPAQFGRGVMADVGQKLIDQFADCLADRLTGAGPEASEDAAPAAAAAEETPHAGAATTDEDSGATITGGIVTTDPNEAELPVPSTATPGTTAGGSTPTDADVPTGGPTPVRGAPGAGPAPGAAPGPRSDAGTEGFDEAIDLLSVASGPVAKRVAPVAAVLGVVLLLWRWRRR